MLLIAGALQSNGFSALEVVFGAGLAAAVKGQDHRPVPLLLINSKKVEHPPGRTNLAEVRQAFNIVLGAIGGDASDWLSDVDAWVLPPPEP